MYELIANYGHEVALYVLAAIGAGLLWIAKRFVDSDEVLKYTRRAWMEVRAAVLEVEQTYVLAIKQGLADGKLTADEKAAAKKKALDIARSNIGVKGLKRLARVFDVEKWMETHVEAFVGALPKAVAIEHGEPVAAPPKQ